MYLCDGIDIALYRCIAIGTHAAYEIRLWRTGFILKPHVFRVSLRGQRG